MIPFMYSSEIFGLTDEKPIKTGNAPGIPPNTVPKGDDLFKNRV